MSAIVKPVMLDETGQITNQKLEELSSKINTVLTSYKDAMNSVLSSNLNTLTTDQRTILTNLANSIDTTLSGFKTGIVAIQTEMKNAISDIARGIVSVTTLNGMSGDVVLDASKLTMGLGDSRTVNAFLSSVQSTMESRASAAESTMNSRANAVDAAIAKTPLTFTATQIEGDDYKGVVTIGTPS